MQKLIANQNLWINSLVALTLTSFFFGGCKGEPDNTAQLLEGRWELVEATRDGQPSETLQDLYFEFLPDGQLNTNIAGGPESALYELDKKTIRQRQSRIEADYTIEEISAQTLVISANIRDYAFRFKLAKSSAN